MKNNYDLIASIFDYDMALNMPFNDVAFYCERISGKKSVLEIGCGTGRITFPVAQICDDVVGIDASFSMLEQLKKKVKFYNKQTGSLGFVVMDARAIALNRKFEYIFFPFSSINYLCREQEVISFLESIKPLLSDNARILLDAFVPKTILSNMTDWVQDYERPIENGHHLKRFKKITPNGAINVIYRRYEKYSIEGVLQQVIHTESHIRPYTPDELVKFVTSTGYEVCNEWWNYGQDSSASAGFYTVEAKLI